MKLERLSLALAASLLLPGAALADDATEARVRNVDVRKIVVQGHDADAPLTGVFVSRVQTNGEDPVMQLQVLGANAEAIALDDLLDGETRSIDLGEGRWADVTRDGELLRLVVDGGEEITIPLDPAQNEIFPGLRGLDHAKQVEVFVTSDVRGELPAGVEAHQFMAFVDEDGNVQQPAGGEGFEWRSEDGATIGSRVVVKRIDGSNPDEADVHVMALPAVPLHGMLAPGADLENLKALEGADPETRERVIAALKEILGGHHAVRFDVQVDDDAAGGERRVLRHRMQPVVEER